MPRSFFAQLLDWIGDGTRKLDGDWTFDHRLAGYALFMILRLLLALLRRRRPTTTHPDLSMFYDMIVYAFDHPL